MSKRASKSLKAFRERLKSLDLKVIKLKHTNLNFGVEADELALRAAERTVAENNGVQ